MTALFLRSSSIIINIAQSLNPGHKDTALLSPLNPYPVSQNESPIMIREQTIPHRASDQETSR